MTTKHILPTVTACCLVAALSAAAQAQIPGRLNQSQALGSGTMLQAAPVNSGTAASNLRNSSLFPPPPNLQTQNQMGQQNQQGTAPATGAQAMIQRGRFLRLNRSARNFVGSDSADSRGFIGAESADNERLRQAARAAAVAGAASAAGASPTGAALLGAAAASGPDAPRPLFPRAQGAEGGPVEPVAPAKLYPPRLKVDFEYSRPAKEVVGSNLSQLLGSCSRLQCLGPIEVSLTGRTATLRGRVASERDRSLAERLVLFEPGISKVENDLVVGPPPEAP
jgi:hypothetical protein